MNFYKHYIGDFQRDTGHLSLTERGAYLCLIHHYYATEKPIPGDHAALCRVAGAITKQERDAVKSAMSFFIPCESGLMHGRIEAEIQKAGKQAETNRDIAIAREAARKAEREAAASSNESSTKRGTNREPIQTPDTRHQEETPIAPKGASSRAVQIQTWLDAVNDAGEEAIPASDPIFAYAEKARIPMDFVALAWGVFVRKAKQSGKRQKSWPQTFRNYVEGNYLKLWALSADGDYFLTTVGKQEQMVEAEHA